MGRAYGFDTAGYITDTLASQARAKFGTGTFYARYLNPSPKAEVMTSSTAVTEERAAWDYGAAYLMPISEPTQSRLNGTEAMGSADASPFCAALLSVYEAVGPLYINASSDQVDVYLCLESSTNMSSAYWQGWWGYVSVFSVPGFGQPLYASLYCDPNSPATNCSSIPPYTAYSIWASTPEPCAACGPFGSVSWQAENCYNSPGSVSTSLVWQMAEQNGCELTCGRGAYPNVDADSTNPGYTEEDNMFYLVARP